MMADEYDYIQEQSARIVDLEVEADTLKQRITALEADLHAARVEALEQAAQYHDRIARQYEDNHPMMGASDHRRFASDIRVLRTAQPEPEAEAS